MKRLEGKTCIVTGGAQGIGKATCLRLADEGARVAITDIDDDDGKTLRDDIQARGGRAEYWHLDVTDEAAVEEVFDDVSGKLGGIDVIVNGVFHCTKHAVPHMRKNGGGSIVNLSSIYGIVGAPDIPPYHASKGAVREMSKTDAVLYAKEGIRVNSVHPGFIWTPLVKTMAEASEDGPEAFRAHLDELHPVGHVGEPEDIAAGIAYLASDDAKFVTGSELVIDGGYTAR